MMWRHLCLARAFAATGILFSSLFGSALAVEPGEPIPAADSAIETVRVLDAETSGKLAVVVRGSGQDSVRVQLRNQSGQNLRVVMPPGLVASGIVAQGGGGGFQNMGLGAAGNRGGGFGQFAAQNGGGFQSIPVANSTVETPGTVTVPTGQTVDLTIPAVCLNFGAPAPTSKNQFRLVDVADYSSDERVQKSLRALATLGTSQGMAQATMWQVCNGITFGEMLLKADKIINPAEVALAAHFVRALESGQDPVESQTARVFLSIEGNPADAKEIARLGRAIDGLRILGLPVQVLARGEVPQAPAPVLHLGVNLGGDRTQATRGKVLVQAGEGIDSVEWSTLGTARLDDLSLVSSLDAVSLANAIDRAVGSTFVTAKVAQRSANGTTLEIRNRLPFTVANITVKAGASANSPLVTVNGIGVGPSRSGQATVAASMGTVDRVELNGL